ncbi:MAG: transcriptional regulator, TetR family [Caulobacteraceae bacterium]|jgi:AcrR family transcriptional regulator|nr:transcriptional regulator, TetR family [Caulobacteraceae bacterium]
MDIVVGRVLAQLEPVDLEHEGENWQKRKSAQTRVVILEAAIDCLEKHGYAHTTTQLIAEIAGVSRGAMLHHYPTRHELIDSVIGYTVFRRMEVLITRLRALSDVDRIENMVGLELYWESLLTREFSAYLELLIASRTDAELAETFLPTARRFNRIELDEVIHVFPEWEAEPIAYSVAVNYLVSSMQGLLINKPLFDDSQITRIRQIIARNIADLLPPAKNQS